MTISIHRVVKDAINEILREGVYYVAFDGNVDANYTIWIVDGTWRSVGKIDYSNYADPDFNIEDILNEARHIVKEREEGRR